MEDPTYYQNNFTVDISKYDFHDETKSNLFSLKYQNYHISAVSNALCCIEQCIHLCNFFVIIDT